MRSARTVTVDTKKQQTKTLGSAATRNAFSRVVGGGGGRGFYALGVVTALTIVPPVRTR